MTRIDEINKEIKSLKEKIVNLENEKNNINFLKKLDLDSKVLKRVGNIHVEVNNSRISNDSDEYASNIKHELKLNHNYTIVEFVSPGEVKAHLCNVELNYKYESNQTYHNRYEPDIECNLEIIARDDKTNTEIFRTLRDQEKGFESILFTYVRQAPSYLKPEWEEWRVIVKALVDKFDGDIDSWNNFIEELDS